jgi:alpha-tubulin suppressor-like RCC1 family protein
MATGNFHSCAVHASTVRCWGYGGDGQLGYGNTRSIGDDETPGSVGLVDLDPGPGPGTAQAIGAGSFHTCALLDGGTVRCWGFGGNGRLGYGNTDAIGDNEAPGSVGPVDLDPGPGLGAAEAISAGNGHTCAVLDQGTVRCWGFNLEGRLGYGHTDAIGDDEAPGSVGPVDLDPGPGLGTAKAISAGGFHTCALLDQGTVRCWGAGGNGRLGYGNIDNIGRTPDTTPETVGPVDLDPGPGNGTAKAISAGFGHTCAILENGTVRCWGAGGSGQLGYGNTRNVGDDETPGSVLPVNLGANRTAKAIRAGGEHTCAVLDDDSVRCWGYGGFGQLGYGNTDTIGDGEAPGAVGPVDLGSGRSAKAISAAALHTCARLDDESVRCWGRGSTGRLGYCNERSIGDDETPGPFGPVDLGMPAGGARCPTAGGPGPSRYTMPARNGGVTYPLDPRLAEAARLRGLRSCLARVTRHARREVRRARRLSGGRRARARRHARRHRRQLRRRCLRRYGRPPGRVTGFKAQAISRGRVVLTFTAPGSDGSRPPAARSYLIKQSRRPIRSRRDFARATSLCRGRCSFRITRVGASLTLTVTDLRRHARYYFAIAARDNVSGRIGPRSRTIRVRVR